MSVNEELRTFSSVGQMMKTPSETPSAAPSRQSSKRMKTSKSSVLVKRSMTPSEVVERDQFEVPKECECSPDLYGRVLGPTADETILAGLKTVIDLCSKLRACGEDEEPEREQNIPEKDVPMITSNIQTEQNMVSAGFQVTPSVKSTTVQTAAFPQVVSELLQTVGLTPEMISKVIQTSFMEPKKPDVASMYMQTSTPSLASNAMQTTQPDLKSGYVQTSLLSVKSPTVPSTTQSELILPESKTKAYTTEQTLAGDEHKNISPPEPPEKVKICKCCKCSSSSNLRRDSKESKSSDEKPCICGSKRKSKCKCDGAKRQMSTDEVHETPSEVRYAVTKICKYNEFTTFEVMKSTGNQPKHMPKTMEGVFVLKKKNGSSNGEVKGVYEGSKSETNGIKRRNSKNGKNGVLKDSKGEINGSKVEAY